MITFSTFGKPGSGRLGNQLFQWASIMGLAGTFGKDWSLPKWEYASYFKTPPQNLRPRKPDFEHKEVHYHHDMEQWTQIDNRMGVHDVWGWLQSEKYWNGDQKKVQAMMQFTDEHLAHVKKKYAQILDSNAPIIAMTIRRGDYVDNPNYYQLPIDYYLHSLYDFFAGHETMANVMVFSDDFNYCRLHLQGLPNVYFAEGTAMEQLAAMTLCDHFILANSTFSWWGAYLGEKETSVVVRPAYHFAGDMQAQYDAKDYYPERWETYDHIAPSGAFKKFDLNDVTFTIPYMCDSADRGNNLIKIRSYLHTHFNTFTDVYEQHMPQVKPFHRTKYLNEMAKMAITPIIANWDTDVLVPIVQILEAVRAIREKRAQMVFPYDGRFARVPRGDFQLDQKSTHQDLSVLAGKKYRGMYPGDQPSVGGAVLWDKDTFLHIGGENENFIDYGPEDVERVARATKLGVKIYRVNGVLYHFDHHVPLGSQKDNPQYKANEYELAKVKNLGRKGLQAYISSWPWRHQYTAKYYETFVESAAVSAVEIFNFLGNDLGQPGNVLDVGCGLGEWSTVETLGWNYYGLDFGAPKDKLRMDPARYIDHDLTSDAPIKLPDDAKIDLALCMEVAEHLPEEHADRLVMTLCAKADIVLFSAAIPHQQGEGHVNEQWQTYWSKLFAKYGYVGKQYHDNPVRWTNYEQIDLWYRQNTVLYMRKVPQHMDLETGVVDFVHPEMYLRIVNHLKR